MSRISYEESQMNTYSGGNNVNFFMLADDGDEAIVRILHDDVSSFDIVQMHQLMIGGKQRKVDCLRSPRDPLDVCPLCDAGNKTMSRFYIHLLRYDKDSDGNIVVSPQVWERSSAYCTTIKNLIDEYGPLSECIFKIHRNGAKGDMKTTYSIMYGNPNIYKEEFYPKDVSGFENYSVVGTIVASKTAEDMNYYLANGEFPGSQDETPIEVVEQKAAKQVPWSQPSNIGVTRPTQRFY